MNANSALVKYNSLISNKHGQNKILIGLDLCVFEQSIQTTLQKARNTTFWGSQSKKNNNNDYSLNTRCRSSLYQNILYDMKLNLCGRLSLTL